MFICVRLFLYWGPCKRVDVILWDVREKTLVMQSLGEGIQKAFEHFKNRHLSCRPELQSDELTEYVRQANVEFKQTFLEGSLFFHENRAIKRSYTHPFNSNKDIPPGMIIDIKNGQFDLEHRAFECECLEDQLKLDQMTEEAARKRTARTPAKSATKSKNTEKRTSPSRTPGRKTPRKGKASLSFDEKNGAITDEISDSDSDDELHILDSDEDVRPAAAAKKLLAENQKRSENDRLKKERQEKERKEKERKEKERKEKERKEREAEKFRKKAEDDQRKAIEEEKREEEEMERLRAECKRKEEENKSKEKEDNKRIRDVEKAELLKRIKARSKPRPPDVLTKVTSLDVAIDDSEEESDDELEQIKKLLETCKKVKDRKKAGLQKQLLEPEQTEDIENVACFKTKNLPIVFNDDDDDEQRESYSKRRKILQRHDKKNKSSFLESINHSTIVTNDERSQLERAHQRQEISIARNTELHTVVLHQTLQRHASEYSRMVQDHNLLMQQQAQRIEHFDLKRDRDYYF